MSVFKNRIGAIEITGRALRREVQSSHQPHPPIISISAILEEVAKAWGITAREMISSSRIHGLARPRHVAFWLADHYSGKSRPHIGRLIGGRDHTTVRYGIDRISASLESDADLRDRVDNITKSLLRRAIESPGSMSLRPLPPGAATRLAIAMKELVESVTSFRAKALASGADHYCLNVSIERAISALNDLQILTSLPQGGSE